jgi:hypothetical protein
LITDYSQFYTLTTETELQSYPPGLFPLGPSLNVGPPVDAMIALRVNPIVDNLLRSLDLEALPDRGEIELAQQLHDRTRAASEAEQAVLDAIRGGDYTRIDVSLADGSIQTVRTTRKPTVDSDLTDLLRAHPYQKLTVHRTDGRVVSIEQQTTFKPATSTTETN